MKKRQMILAALAVLVCSGVRASEYGCTVLLCLANPNGPKAVSQCVPPINQLFHDLARGRSFPTCDLASAPSGSGSGRSWAQQGISYYDPCPAGTTALGAGVYAVQASATQYYVGIGEGDDRAPNSSGGDSDNSMPGKVCVGNKTGDTWLQTGTGDDMNTFPVGTYDRVILMDAVGSPNVIDVYVDSALYRRVRW